MRTVISLHPEELLDRDARGLLSPADRARLDDHLAQCAACRLERQLRDDFADELESDVTPSAIERLTLASVSQPRAEVTPPPPPPPPVTLAPRGRATRAAWLLVAAAVFAVSAASARASSVVQRAWSRIVDAPEAPTTVAVAPHAVAAVAHHASIGSDARTSEPALPREVPTNDVLLAAPVAPEPAHVGVRAAHPQPNPAAALFDEATEARRHGDYARALTLGRDLQARFPRSREAHVSRATLGRLLLDRGDPSTALANFDAYLGSGSGDLGEEAMIGRATALERLGRTFEAARAWQALLAAYPQTSYAAHARARLGGPGVR
jgi:TolA-binding protein